MSFRLQVVAGQDGLGRVGLVELMAEARMESGGAVFAVTRVSVALCLRRKHDNKRVTGWPDAF